MCNTAAAQAPVVVLAPTYVVEKFNIGGAGSSTYLTAEAGTGRVFVSRETHVMVVDGPTGKVLGDIPNTPQVRGIALALKWNHGFTTNAGDSTVTMFDLEKLTALKQIKVPTGGLDGILYDPIDDRIVLTNQSRPVGTVTFIDPQDGKIVGAIKLADSSPRGPAFDDRGQIYVANELKSSIQVIDVKTLKVRHTWPLGACVGPKGVAMDLRTNRLMVACSKKSVVLDAISGKLVASFENGDGVDGMAWDPADHFMYIPSGTTGSITVVRMMTLNSFKPVATIKTLPGAKTLAHDPSSRLVYQFGFANGAAVFVKVSH
jgi:YVTN family beta-propeller protein